MVLVEKAVRLDRDNVSRSYQVFRASSFARTLWGEIGAQLAEQAGNRCWRKWRPARRSSSPGGAGPSLGSFDASLGVAGSLMS